MHRKLGARVCCEAVRSAILATAWLLVVLYCLVNYGFWCIFVFNLLFLCVFLEFISKFSYFGWPVLLTLGFSGNPALLLMFRIHYCRVFESSKYLLLFRSILLRCIKTLALLSVLANKCIKFVSDSRLIS